MRLFTCLALLILSANWVIAAEGTIILISSGLPGGNDATTITHLEGLGFEVEVHSEGEGQPVKTSGAAAVFIAESVTSGNVAGAYKDSPVPVVICESWLLDEMGFVEGVWNAEGGGCPFVKNPDLSVTIADANHPIAGGLSGNVDIVTGAGQILTCVVEELPENTDIVATIANGDAALSCCEKGTKYADGSVMPARRVISFLHDSAIPLLTDDGWTLIENSVLWAVGAIGSVGGAVDPRETMTTTWAALKAQ